MMRKAIERSLEDANNGHGLQLNDAQVRLVVDCGNIEGMIAYMDNQARLLDTVRNMAEKAYCSEDIDDVMNTLMDIVSTMEEWS
jgi:hypothetical protein